MTNEQKAEAYRNAIMQLEQQRFGKETEITMIDAQIKALQREMEAVFDPSIGVPSP